MKRRTFLGRLAAAGLGGHAFVGCAPGGTESLGGANLERLGLQLYTVRDQLRQSFAATLATIAEIGYREVETAGLQGLTAAQFRTELDRVGLSSPAGHYGLAELRQNATGTFDTAQALGQQWVIVPSLDANDRTADGFRRVADELNRYAVAARERGLRVGYHNHDFEFRPLDGLGAEGPRHGYDLLLAGTDPALVSIELDIYWAVRGGYDPVALFSAHPGRFPLCHLKDMADRDGSQSMADVGRGEIDFPTILSAAGVAGLQHYFVEHDNAPDPLASIRRSFDYLRTVGG
jgi:sugar phosphate isomerase/epimerase